MAAARIDTLLLSETVAKRTIALNLFHMASTYSCFRTCVPPSFVSFTDFMPRPTFAVALRPVCVGHRERRVLKDCRTR